jgi:phenylalanyl-tRNA synthetase beta chain
LRGEPLLHPGRAATVRATQDARLALAGTLGELHPSLDDDWELRGVRLVVAELDLSGLGGAPVPNVIAAPPPRHPAAERDLAVVVAEDQPAGSVAEAIRRHAGPVLETLSLFDVYRGAPLAGGEKSLAFRLSFRAADRTLEEAEVDAAIDAISASLPAEVGGRIRT